MAALFRSGGICPVQRPPGVSSNRTAAENNRMKHLLSGIAIVTALAIAAPVSVQAQTSGSRPARPTAHKSGAHSSAARAHRGGSAAMSQGGDNVANQLNGQELQRLQASSAPPPMPMPVARPQPGLSTNSGTYIPPSRPGPVSTYDPSAMGPRDSGGGYIPAPTGPMPMPPPPPAGVRPSGY